MPRSAKPKAQEAAQGRQLARESNDGGARSAGLPSHSYPKRLDTKAAAKYLLDHHGTPTAERSLHKLASIGGGPPYRKWGKIRVYETEDLDAWVESRLSQKVGSSSELGMVSDTGASAVRAEAVDEEALEAEARRKRKGSNENSRSVQHGAP